MSQQVYPDRFTSRLVELPDGNYYRAELVEQVRLVRVRLETDPEPVPFSSNNVYSGYGVAVDLRNGRCLTQRCRDEENQRFWADSIVKRINSAMSVD